MKNLRWLFPILGATGVIAPTNCFAQPNVPQLYVSCTPWSTTIIGYTAPMSYYPGYANYQTASFNGWNLNVQGKVTGDATHPTLDLLIQATSPGVLSPYNGGPLYIGLSETGFGSTSGSYKADLSVTATGNAQPIWIRSYYNPSNTFYGTTTALTSAREIGPVVYSSSITSDPVTLNNYLLGESITIEHPPFGQGSVEAPGASYTIHATLTLIPEPSVATLAIAALAILYRTRRISRRQLRPLS